MAPVRAALDTILTGHEPFPAVIVDHRWDLVSANRTALAIMADDVSPQLLAPPVNTLRVSLHPDGLAPRITNLAQYSEHLVSRLRRQLAVAPDPDVAALLAELQSYPGVVSEPSTALDTAALLFVPLRLRTSAGDELSFFSTLATFGTALDITLADLSIESFFPADDATDRTLRSAVA